MQALENPARTNQLIREPTSVASPAAEWATLVRYHTKRNSSEYAGLVNASEAEARDLIEVTSSLRDRVRAWLGAHRPDIPGFDALLLWPLFAIAFTAFAVGGVANAINIIDGYNGVAGGYAVLAQCSYQQRWPGSRGRSATPWR